MGIADILWQLPTLATQARGLAHEIDEGIKKHAVVRHDKYGDIYAYEVDGHGHSNLMDDANIPSLMSIPYLGYKYDPEIYSNTRRFILSPDNPTFAKSNNGKIKGYGSL